MRRRIQLVVLVALLAAPAGAQANRIDRMRPVGDEAFPQVAQRCGRVAVTTEFEDTYVGRAALGMNLPGCRIAIREGLSRRETCLVMVHEWGHKAGLGHSSDPLSIMSADPTVVHYPPCARFERLELRLGARRLDLDTARYDRRHTQGREHRSYARQVRRLLRRIQTVKADLGP